MSRAIVLEAKFLARYYPVSQGLGRPPKIVKALNGVSFSLEAGKTVAIVGESGCGKSTLARQLTLIEAPSVSGHKTDLTLRGELPSPFNPPTGCALHQRCPHAQPRCAQEEPALREWQGRLVACLRLEEIAA